ncbi:hypothetical protein [Burkholderia sp. Ac-20379]|uniref:hypothetical protein n=1 Tax=Burkholderia sp. Ac-20379 TaxID=2703900 RepID=UPI00197E10B2|nr:hypothetical protein [Burkholderia sp. Ac-20379]MBN3726088.1 hypothetical protein [Burkholderia sp. Ac-20379]
MRKYLNLGLFGGALAVGALVTALVRWPPMQSSDWAAWVQAVGSIGAIAAAIWIQDRQRSVDRENEQRRELAEMRRKFAAWEGIAMAAIQLIRVLPPAAFPMDDIAPFFAERELRIKYQTAVDALDSIQIDAVYPYPVMATILDLRRDLAYLRPLLMPEDRNPTTPVRHWLRMEDQIQNMRTRADEYESVFNAYGSGLHQKT